MAPHNKCTSCSLVVYDADLVRACDAAWHQACFKCTTCDVHLSLKAYATYSQKPYCAPHFLAVATNEEEVSSPSMSAVLKGVDSAKSDLKHAETVDKSGPVIEEGTAVKKVDRSGFLDSVSKGTDLKKAETVDKSGPVVDEKVEVKTVDRKAQLATFQKAAVAKSIKSTDSDGLKSTTTVDKSGPVIEKVEIKKIDRSGFTSEVESGKPLKQVDEVKDRSAPIIEEGTSVKKVDRKGILADAAKVGESKDEKLKPTESADRSEPRPSRFGTKKDICAGCSKRVYQMDLLSACDKAWHKGCFRCTHCNSSLRINGYSAIAGDPYCRAHYAQLFKSSGGTYDSFTDDNARQVFNASSAFKGY